MLLEEIARPQGFDRLSELVHDLALTGLNNDEIANICGTKPSGVEAALYALRKGGCEIKRASWNANTLKRAFGIAAVVSRNLFHAKDAHKFVVRISKELGRTTDWIYAMVIWYRTIITDARVSFGAEADASIPELKKRLFRN